MTEDTSGGHRISPGDVAVSVVIPCYNKAEVVGETLESVLAQTVPPAEVIVVDDGSTDGSGEVVRSYGPPIRLLTQPNRGESVARNRAIERAEGEWVALLDADDVWVPERLERQLSLLQSHPGKDIVCVYSDAYLFRGGEKTGEHRKPEYHAAEDWRVQMLRDWSVNPSSALVRADVLRTVRFPEDVRHSEDMLFFLELREHGRFLRIPECLVGYRQEGTNQTASIWHKYHSVASRYGWLQRNAARYSNEDRERLRRALAEQLLYPHDVALSRTRDTELVRRCRTLYHRVHPTPLRDRPTSLDRRLYPRWAYRVRDALPV